MTILHSQFGGRPILRNWRVYGAGILAALSLSACAPSPYMNIQQPTLQEETPVLKQLRTLPPPARPLYVAVYRFDDQTGQNKPGEDFAEYSKAVSQGGASILANALKQAGSGSWFKVLEREQLGPLMEERKLIMSSWMQTARPQPGAMPPIPPLLNAGLLLTGGIVGYDSNIRTGGTGARYLGIGGDSQYRVDNVSVYLRAVSVKTGEVLEAVVVNKTLYSAAIRAGVFRYVAADELLELETGTTSNEPGLLALKQAFEKAVLTLVVQGAKNGHWSFGGSSDQKIIAGPDGVVLSMRSAPSGVGATPMRGS
jgi:curli production assembly/transport component CsgG